MHNIAAIDVGSNAMRLVVGRIVYEGKVEAVENLRLPVRLGQDAFAAGVISQESAQRALDAFMQFRKVAERHGVEQIRAVATSALREAANSETLKERIAKLTGIEVEVIGGEEEARLIHLAASQAVNLKNRRGLLIDIGGGSVEVTLSRSGRILSSESYNIGTVRLLEKLGGEVNSALTFQRLVREYAESARRRMDREFGAKRIDVCIGTGGNIEEMGRLRQRLFKRESDRLIALEELDNLVEILVRMGVKERIRKLNLKPDRADVLLPAAVVLQMIAHEARIGEILIPNVGLKDGVMWDMAYNLQKNSYISPREQVWTSALRLGKKYQFDQEHARVVSRLAGSLFDQSRELHHLEEENKLLLETAALLHDIGHFINPIDHHRHGYYILKANPLMGLTERQQEVVASLILFHRKSMPPLEDENSKNLPPGDRAAVIKLAALLRLADVLDVNHAGNVQKARLESGKKEWRLILQGSGDLTLEKWTLEKRRKFFRDAFGADLTIAG